MMNVLKVLVFLLPAIGLGQNTSIAFLKLALKNAKHDTTRCNILNKMVEAEPSDSIWTKYNDQMGSIAQINLNKNPPENLKAVFLKYLATVYNNKGYLTNEHGDMVKALKYYKKGLDLQEQIHDKRGIATSLSNMAVIYFNQGDVTAALENDQKALKLMETLNDHQGVATLLNNIGEIYKTQEDLENALEYYKRGLTLMMSVNDQQSVSTFLDNIGSILYKQNNLNEALEYYQKCLKVEEEIKYRYGMAFTFK
ncbi:MAG: tetratricopeptide repeat protein [Bacteroidetes bacterium]|nr:tetratricopeptide repeat protein [Bacteroidota bacterium]